MTDFAYPITFLYTHDLDATARFYEQVLGLELARDQGDCRIYRIGAHGLVGFCHRVGAAAQPQGVIITLVTEDVDGWYARLVAQGVVFEHPPALNPKYNIYHCFVRDPNGYLVEIQRFNEPLT